MQVADVVHGITSRLMVPLAIGGALLMLSALTGTLLRHSELMSISVALVALMAPIPSSVSSQQAKIT